MTIVCPSTIPTFHRFILVLLFTGFYGGDNNWAVTIILGKKRLRGKIFEEASWP